MLRQGRALHLLNDNCYGQIVNLAGLPEGKLHPELFRIFQNHDLWERRYILQLVRDSETDDPNDVPKIMPAETFTKGFLYYLFTLHLLLIN